jgi:altronate dehydratase small subunit
LEKGYSQEKMIILYPRDNVGIIKKDVEKGEMIVIDEEKFRNSIKVRESIPYRFKIALRDIHIGEEILKSGEIIGKAKEEIKKGEMVHVHNIEGLRGRGDLQNKE